MDFHAVLGYLAIAVEIVFAFGLVILFHELGHFVVAKLNGVEAPEFSFGMGPEIVGVNWRGTRYKICLFPIGGYVRMVGEEDDETLEANVPRERNFRYKTPLQKISIVFAGPFMNVVLAIAMFAMIFMVWGIPRSLPIPEDGISKSVDVVFVDPRLSAAKAGLRTGDVVLSVDGRSFKDKIEMEGYIQTSGKKTVRLEVLRNTRKIELSVKPKYQSGERGKIGATLYKADDKRSPGGGKYVAVEGVFAGDPAEKAGMKAGDVILAVDGEKITDTNEVIRYIKSHADKKITFKIDRGGKNLEVAMKPESRKSGDIGAVFDYPAPREVTSVVAGSPASAAGLKKGDVILDFNGANFEGADYAMPAKSVELHIYRANAAPAAVVVSGKAGEPIGAGLLPTVERVGLFKALWYGTQRSFGMVAMIYYSIVGMIRRDVSTDGLGGPVAIVQYASSFARQGIKELISFFGAISITLAVMNLFPFPALDGSRIVFHAIEAIRRKPLDPHREGLIHYVGFCILIAFIILITIRDVRLWLGF
jgi:regulator of sigma E protease